MDDSRRQELAASVRSSLEFFERSTACLEEADSAFAPAPELMTVAQQVAHVANTIRWFVEGAFSPSGFDMNFENHAIAARAISSLAAARSELRAAYSEILEGLGTAELDWDAPIAPNPIMAGEPRFHIVEALVEHSAHHRGVLSVYSRLLGKTPSMPYM